MQGHKRGIIFAWVSMDTLQVLQILSETKILFGGESVGTLTDKKTQRTIRAESLLQENE